jgi:hypothetical protein
MTKVIKETALSEIKEYINAREGKYDQWYAGITEDPKKRLFTDHAVKHDWIYRECFSSDSARWVEEKLLDLGCKGDTGGGDDNTIYVYAYKITSDTNE